MNHPIQGILLDIEGTTSSIRFVTDTMFPFVRANLSSFLSEHAGNEAVVKLGSDIRREAAGLGWVDEYNEDPQLATIASVNFLMDRDDKTTGLKDLQGRIWESGFHSGELVAHVYADVPPALRAWKAKGLDLRIYSSGSVAAQKLFFGHTVAGDLLPLFSAHYDTTVGPKRDVASYQAIAKNVGIPSNAILFVSDVWAELIAAQAAGLCVALSVRPGNAPVPELNAAEVQTAKTIGSTGITAISSFDQLDVHLGKA